MICRKEKIGCISIQRADSKATSKNACVSVQKVASDNGRGGQTITQVGCITADSFDAFNTCTAFTMDIGDFEIPVAVWGDRHLEYKQVVLENATVYEVNDNCGELVDTGVRVDIYQVGIFENDKLVFYFVYAKQGAVHTFCGDAHIIFPEMFAFYDSIREKLIYNCKEVVADVMYCDKDKQDTFCEYYMNIRDRLTEMCYPEKVIIDFYDSEKMIKYIKNGRVI